MIRIRIPATSANIGAGFDCIGLAVNLYNYIDMEESDISRILSCDGSWVPDAKDNLVYTSASRLYEICGKKLSGLRLVMENNIPMTRGLGSSSACIIGGLVGANALLGNPVSTQELVNIAAQLEGHPDNTTPALLGGIVTAVMSNNQVYWVKQDINKDLRMVAIIPDFRMSTAAARKSLPKSVSHMDARFNLSRAALLSASILQGKYENIRVAVDDKLHQPYRMNQIPHSRDIFNKAYELGAYGVYISGAGPTIMAFVDNDNDKFTVSIRDYLLLLGLDGWDIKELGVDNDGTMVLT